MSYYPKTTLQHKASHIRADPPALTLTKARIGDMLMRERILRKTCPACGSNFTAGASHIIRLVLRIVYTNTKHHDDFYMKL